MEWYKHAAQAGYANAQFNLGTRYTTGKGILKNYIKAYIWTSLAASQGLEVAEKNKSDLAIKMTTEDLYEAKRLAGACYERAYQYCW